MTHIEDKTLRLVFPQWQGGNNPSYHFGAELLSWLAPAPTGPVENVPVTRPSGQSLHNENGIVGRDALIEQLLAAEKLIEKHRPDNIVVLGGDCLVSLAPFAWLSERYGEELGVLWIDSHPDVMTPAQFSHAHAHVLGALMGNGDPDLTQAVRQPVLPQNIMIAGIHHPLEHEEQFLSENNIRTCSPEDVRAGAKSVAAWIIDQQIKYLAIHIDLDVLDPTYFRSVLFARPGRGENDFGGAAEGKLTIADVLALVNTATAEINTVGVTIAEHLPWDAINLKTMLAKLPLLGASQA